MSQKKLWSFFNFAIPISFLFFGKFIPSTQGVPDQIAQLLMQIKRDFAAGFVFGLINAFILFRCAYRKPGTKYLTFCLFCSCVAIPCAIYSIGSHQTVISVLKNAHAAPETIQIFYTIRMLTICPLLMQLVFAYLSLKLRQYNKQLQFEELLTIPTYQALFQTLQTTSDATELKTKYREWLVKHPGNYLVHKESL